MPGLPYWCCCPGCPCPGKSLKITIADVVTTAGRRNFACFSIDLVGEFENGDFTLNKIAIDPVIAAIGFYARDPVNGGLSVGRTPFDPNCTFLAKTPVRGYSPLRYDTYFTLRPGGDGEGAYVVDCSIAGDARDFDSCDCGLVALVTKTTRGLLLQVNTTYYDIDGSDAGAPGLVFSGILTYDAEAGKWNANNEVGGAAVETYFSGGTAVMECVDLADDSIPGAVGEDEGCECAPYYYLVDRINADARCTDGALTNTRYFAERLSGYFALWPQQFAGGSCAAAEAVARAYFAYRRSLGDARYGEINAGWRPNLSNVLYLGGDVYAGWEYFWGHCVGTDISDDVTFAGFYYASGDPNVTTMPGFDVFGYAPTSGDCGPRKCLYLLFGIFACPGGANAYPIAPLSIACFAAEAVEEGWQLTPAGGLVLAYGYFYGGDCSDGSCAGDTIPTPDPPTAEQITAACPPPCQACGDCKYSPSSTASVSVDTSFIAFDAPSMSLVAGEGCKWRASGMTFYETYNIYPYNEGQSKDPYPSDSNPYNPALNTVELNRVDNTWTVTARIGGYTQYTATVAATACKTGGKTHDDSANPGPGTLSFTVTDSRAADCGDEEDDEFA